MKKNLFAGLIIVLISVSVSCWAVSRQLERYPVSSLAGEPYMNVSGGRQVSFDGEYPDFTYAAEASVEAVVFVKVLKRTQGSYAPSILDLLLGYNTQGPREEVTSGSGVIITEDGYVVTNYHVIAGATEIEVKLNDQKTYKAQLVGSDPATDIALLKVDAQHLPTLSFGDSDQLRLGEWVLAIGAPYGLTSTITAGIVSAKGRSMPNYDGEFRIESFIQTDAAVNPGNSGGALVNVKGELVGINTAIISQTGSYAGYSFAVPVNIVRKIVEDLIDFGSVQRAFLGVSMAPMSDALARELDMDRPMGVFLARIVPGGAADQGGVEEGDVLLQIDGVVVNSPSDVQERITRYSPGDVAELILLRDGKQRNLRVRLMGNEAMQQARNQSMELFGAQLRTVTPQEAKRLMIASGVEVVSLGKGKFKTAGISTGFVITHVNNQEVETPDDIKGQIEQSRRSILVEGIYPDGRVAYYGIGL